MAIKHLLNRLNTPKKTTDARAQALDQRGQRFDQKLDQVQREQRRLYAAEQNAPDGMQQTFQAGRDMNARRIDKLKSEQQKYARPSENTHD